MTYFDDVIAHDIYLFFTVKDSIKDQNVDK